MDHTEKFKSHTATLNQIFHYICCISPKAVTSLRDLSPRHYAWATQLLSKKCSSNGAVGNTVSDLNGARFEPQTFRSRDERICKYIIISQIKSNLSLYSLYYAEACNEFAGPISASLRLSNTAPFEEMLQRWQTVGNTVFDLTGPRFKPQTSRSRDERVTARLTVQHTK